MDAKLKALKVVDLKQILSSAGVSAPAKATKNDLIAKILASKEALDAYAKLHPPDDLLAPPEEVDWDQPESVVEPAPVAKPAAPTTVPAVVSPEPAPTTTAPDAADTPVTVDPDFEKRRQRAERFGIPLVEPKVNRPKVTKAVEKAVTQNARPLPKQQNQPATSGRKRTAPQEELDPEELERRRKRAERFGTGKE